MDANYVNQLEQAYQQSQSQNQQLAHAANSTSMFGSQNDSNLIEWQLEVDNILERIQHLLRGDNLTNDAHGNMVWLAPKDNRMAIFNEFGVSEIMRILQSYINRNTILSNYDEKTIDWKVYDLGYEIADLIFLKYEQMFASPSFEECAEILKKRYAEKESVAKLTAELLERDSYEISSFDQLAEDEVRKEIEKIKHDSMKEKIKLYPMIVKEVVDNVHSAYLRALGGGERESLRTARTVSQTEQPMGQQMSMNQNKFSIFKPTSWAKA